LGTSRSRRGETRIIEVAYRELPGMGDWPIGLSDPAVVSCAGSIGTLEFPAFPANIGDVLAVTARREVGGAIATCDGTEAAIDPADEAPVRDGVFPAADATNGETTVAPNGAPAAARGAEPASGEAPALGSWPKTPLSFVTAKALKTLNTSIVPSPLVQEESRVASCEGPTVGPVSVVPGPWSAARSGTS
jgi:hypothetical protein